MANANVAYIENCDKDSNRLTEEILKKDYINYYDLMDKGYDLIENNTWDLRFKKIKPYSEDNELSVFRTDPFDLKRLFYKERGVQQVVLIPPEKKPVIIEELKRLNITEDFVYPDMDNVANEISEQLVLCDSLFL